MVFDAENVDPWKKDESPRSPQPVPRKPHIHKKASFHKLPVKYEECSAGNFVCKNVNQCIPSKYNFFSLIANDDTLSGKNAIFCVDLTTS